jgi:hypothetical protein
VATIPPATRLVAVATLVSLNKAATVSSQRSNLVMDSSPADSSLVMGSSRNKAAMDNRSSPPNNRVNTVSRRNNNRLATDSSRNNRVVMDSQPHRQHSPDMANHPVAVSPVVMDSPAHPAARNLVMDNNREHSPVMASNPEHPEHSPVMASSPARSLVMDSSQERNLVMVNRRPVVSVAPCSKAFKACSKEWPECRAWATQAHQAAQSRPCAMHS